MGRWTSGGDRRAAATVAVRLATLHADPAAGPRGPGKSLAHPVFVFLPSAPTSQRNRETKTPPLLFKHLKGVECCTALCQSEVLESPGNILDMVQVDRCGAAALCPGFSWWWGWYTFSRVAWWEESPSLFYSVMWEKSSNLFNTA